MVILAAKVIADRGVLGMTDRENLDQEIESIEVQEAQDRGNIIFSILFRDLTSYYFPNRYSAENEYHPFISDHGIVVEIEMKDHAKKNGRRGDHHHLEVKKYGFLGRTQESPISTCGHQMA